MPEPIFLGRFREFGVEESAPSIVDALGRLDDEVRVIVADYLTEGVALTAVPGSGRDVLDGEPLMLSSALLTDGVFVWRRYLSHYVRKYGVELPDNFIQKVLTGVRPPAELEEDRFVEIDRWAYRYETGKDP